MLVSFRSLFVATSAFAVPIEVKKEEKKEEKPPVIDPKIVMLVPVATFAAFGFIALTVLIVGIVKWPKDEIEAPGTVHGAVSTEPSNESNEGVAARWIERRCVVRELREFPMSVGTRHAVDRVLAP